MHKLEIGERYYFIGDGCTLTILGDDQYVGYIRYIWADESEERSVPKSNFRDNDRLIKVKDEKHLLQLRLQHGR